ncbi:polysaccharide biosynthesis tyrosine autokinase [Bradyrhizobium sp.]|uniref:polysaccharide biosynthesis tyrosine autokinase n=1 Tax=Bradyrhizobium sp. TaxID=376 RepID=UPI003C15F236
MMLQLRNAKPVAEFNALRSTAMSPGEILGVFASLTRRRLAVIVLVFSLSVMCGAVYLYTAPAKFLAQAELLIDTKKSQLFQQQSVIGDIAMDSAAVDSQIQVLKSENIATSVVKDLHLTSEPEFVGSKPGLVGTILDYLLPSTPTSEFDLQQRAVDTFRKGLVARRIGTSYVIEIGFLSLSPDRAAEIANATADAYIVDQLEAKYQATRRASAWLQDRIQELRQQASTAERAVLDFKKENNIVDTGGRLIGEQQLAELNSQIVLARAATAEAHARLNRISDITKHDITDIDNILRSPDPAVADALRNEVINKLRSEFLDLANREAVFSARLGHDHLIVVNLRNQMFEIRRSIMDELKRIQETFKSDYEIAMAREQSIQNSLAEAVSQNQTTNQAQISLKDLDSKAQTFRALHDNFVQRYMESIQQQSFPFTEARVITHATRPRIKSQPNTILVMALASASGLLLAFGVAMLIDISERGFRTPEQVESELKTICLAVVPLLGADAHAPKPAAAERSDRVAARHLDQSGVLFSVVGSPFSRFAEAFRTIKVSIDVFALAKRNKIVGVTSTVPNEGKSTVAANLARLIAHAGGKAILIDGDLRNPSLTRALAPQAEIGLLEVLSGKKALADAIWSDTATSLAFLPMVAKARLSHSNEILASAAMKQMIDGIREVYDYILIDLPPLTPVVDVRATTQIIDSYLFVVEWGRTDVEVVERALGSAPLVYERLLGVVLNKAELNRMRNYSGDAGYDYQSKYHERYGFED